MDKILSKIKCRILEYIDYKGIKKVNFYNSTNISPSNFKANAMYSEIGGEIIAKILTVYSDINADWLLTGKGEMLKSTADQVEKIQPEAHVNDAETGLMELIHNNATLVETNKKLTDSLLNLTNRLLKDE